VHGDGTDVDEPPHAGGHGGSHEGFEAAHVRLVVFGRRAPRPGAGRAVDDAIDTRQGRPDRGAVADVGGEDVSADRCQPTRVISGVNERPWSRAARDEKLGDVAAEEARRSRYEDRHRLSNLQDLGPGVGCHAGSGSSH
jgi:hypothetical protein